MISTLKLLPVVLALAQGTLGGGHDICGEAVTVDGNYKPNAHSRMRDCESYMRTTVLPAPRTTTITTTFYPYPAHGHVYRRGEHDRLDERGQAAAYYAVVTVRPTHVPGYAKACSGNKYSSACYKWGFHPHVSSGLQPVKTKTITVTAPKTKPTYPTCPVGKDKCDDACVDKQTDGHNCGRCGNKCDAGKVCHLGQCTRNCPALRTACGNSCVDTQIDPSNCGACGTLCSSGDTCVAGHCTAPTPQCTGSHIECGGVCVDPLSDNSHCGTCSTQCTGSLTCVSGTCGCTGGQTACGSACVDTSSDSNHCGTCSNQCTGSLTCLSGTCGCTGGQTACGSACVDTSSDNNHCGTCSTQCTGSLTCVSGTCGCTGGQTACGTACVDTSSDINHCGSCSTQCSGGGTCVSGTCIPPDPCVGLPDGTICAYNGIFASSQCVSGVCTPF